MSSPFDNLSPRAAWFMENFDIFGLAEICASGETGQAALERVRVLAADWHETGKQPNATIGFDEAAVALLAALDEPQPAPETVRIPVQRLVHLEAAAGAVQDLIAWCEDPKHRGKPGLPHSVVAKALRDCLNEPKES